jgi:hypothetical protein
MQANNRLQLNSGDTPQRLASQPRVLLGAIPIIALMLVWPLGRGSKVMMTNSSAVPGAKGVIHVSQTSNSNTKAVMNVQYLAQPSALTPTEVAYVVWVQPNGHSAENKGQLQVGSNRKGSITVVTPYKQFAIFVTAEQSPQARQPSDQRVLSAHVSEDD